MDKHFITETKFIVKYHEMIETEYGKFSYPAHEEFDNEKDAEAYVGSIINDEDYTHVFLEEKRVSKSVQIFKMAGNKLGRYK